MLGGALHFCVDNEDYFRYVKQPLHIGFRPDFGVCRICSILAREFGQVDVLLPLGAHQS